MVRLEAHVKATAKVTDTKTAPHIVDLLVLANLAELNYAFSPQNRKVQGLY